MLYVNKKSTYWELQERLSLGAINYVNFPLPDAVYKEGIDRIVFASGALRLKYRRSDIVVPQGESMDSFLSGLLNPSPEIIPGTGGGGVIETNIFYIITPTYSILDTNYILVATLNCYIRLPTITLPYGQEFEIHPNGFNLILGCDSPGGDRIINEESINVTGRDSVTVRSIDANNWGLI